VNYQSGRMGMAEGIGLAYSITSPLVFLATPAIVAEAAGPLSWATPLLGGLVTGGLLWILQALLTRYPGGDILSLAGRLLGRLAVYPVGLFFFFALFATACLWTRQFAENTLLTALPQAEFSTIILVYGLAAMLLVYLGIEAMSRVTFLILPFAIAGLFLVFAGLSPEMRPLYIFPILGNGLPSLLKPTLLFVGGSAPTVLLMLLAPAFQNAKTVQAAIIFGFGGGAVIRSAANAVFVMTFGAAIAAEKTLPFYEMARLIYLNRYIQRFEALFILLWVMVGVIGVAACLYGALYTLARLFRLPTPKPLILPLGLLMVQIASIPPDAAVVLSLGTMLFANILAPGFAFTTLALLAAAWLRRRKQHA
jgi:spore germination protein KB